MPIYEYKCLKCLKKKELLRKVALRDRPVKCAKCRVPMVRQLVTPKLNLKGKGFYKEGFQ